MAERAPYDALMLRSGARTDHRPPWENWAGLATAHPQRVLTPASTAEVAATVSEAAARGIRVKMVGTGHSFTDVATTDGWMLRPEGLTGLRSVDRDALRVSVGSGTPLHVLNEQLHHLGLSLHNMGDIAAQTVAGALSTGTHGAGGRWASLSAQVTALELVTGDGSVRTVSAEQDRALFDAARVGLGALGIITAVTFRVEPAFTLEAVEEALPWSAVVAAYDEIVDGNEHVDMYWFPYADRVLVKRNNRTSGEPAPLSGLRSFVEDDLLENTAFGLVTGLGDAIPAAVPRLNRFAARAWSGRTYSDAAHRVFTASRRVVFREMEYALPRAAGMEALTEVRRLVERSGWPIGFPVEVRAAPAEDPWLSTAYGRETVYLAVHVSARTDHHTYFGELERLLHAYDGRPHWGKLHGRAAADLEPSFARWADFAAVRDRVDPDRLFGNAYLDRVLGR